MKRQEKPAGKLAFSTGALEALRAAYRALDHAVSRQPWLVQGSVNIVAPKSPAASVTYTWTRKVRAKTLTVALSPGQTTAFRQAIEANRQIEAALSRLRELSHTTLLHEVPGVTKRRSDVPQNAEVKSVPKRA